jgi:hypothetical protein
MIPLALLGGLLLLQPVPIGSFVPSTVQQTDGGVQVITVESGFRSTYAGVVYHATVATPVYVSYFLVLQGSASRTVRVTRVNLSAQETTAGQQTFALYKLTGLTDGGVPTAMLPASYDSANAPSSATLEAYESGTTPSSATSALLRDWVVFVPAQTTASAGTQVQARFGEHAQDITLHGPGEYLALTFIGGLPAGLVVNATIEWVEF